MGRGSRIIFIEQGREKNPRIFTENAQKSAGKLCSNSIVAQFGRKNVQQLAQTVQQLNCRTVRRKSCSNCAENRAAIGANCATSELSHSLTVYCAATELLHSLKSVQQFNSARIVAQFGRKNVQQLHRENFQSPNCATIRLEFQSRNCATIRGKLQSPNCATTELSHSSDFKNDRSCYRRPDRATLAAGMQLRQLDRATAARPIDRSRRTLRFAVRYVRLQRTNLRVVRLSLNRSQKSSALLSTTPRLRNRSSTNDLAPLRRM